MTADQERWAEAAMVQRLHGDGAQAHVADRIADLLLKGDQAGIERWCEIGARVAGLPGPGAVQ
ncbi:DUF6961 family protein [uncultured Sphingomonas sp.]|uniref:DUF6961 family protein n=1 Tax=uncultured Sphingomonas sp. TaxID=158754 RepID=UPI0035CBD5C0